MKKHLRLMKLSAAGLAAAMVVTGAVPNVPVLNKFNVTVETEAATDIYTNYIPTSSDSDDALSAKQVTFAGYKWYIIEDNSVSTAEGTVTLLAADDSFGTSQYNEVSGNVIYKGSIVETLLNSYTETGTLKDFQDVIKTVTLQDPNDAESTITAKLYLLSQSEAEALPINVRKVSFEDEGQTISGYWWLRTPGYVNSNNWQTCIKPNGEIEGGGHVANSFGVRPALQLDLSSVLFSSGTKTFYTEPAASVTVGDVTTNYGTFSEALTAWADGSTLTLNSDITTDSEIVVSGNKTLDLNGHSITNSTSEFVIVVSDGAVLTVDGNGSINNETGSQASVAIKNNNGILNINDATITSKMSGITTFGGTTNIYSGTITLTDGAGTAINAFEGATFNIYGGTIQSYNWLCVYSENSGTNVNIYGGVFEEKGNSNGSSLLNTSDGTITIYGGYFPNKISNAKYTLASGCSVVDSDDTEKGEKMVVSAASVTVGDVTTYYSTFDEALSAWSENSTLTLMSDVEISSTINVNAAKTLDLNGYGIKMTGNDSVISVANNGNLTLKDSNSDNQTHKYTISEPTANGAGLAVVNDDAEGEDVETFTGGYLTGGSAANGNGSGVNVEGIFNLTGGTIIGNKSSYQGGGVCVNADAEFNMTGGALIGNTATYGGGVGSSSSGSDFTKLSFSGGTVAYNKSTGTGGGIHMNANTGRTTNGIKITLSGAITVENNHTNGTWGGNANAGGGVVIDGMGAVFSLSGSPTIRGNTAGEGTDSHPVVNNNIYFTHRGTPKVNVENFTPTTPVGITLMDKTGVFTNSTDTMFNDVSQFTSDNTSYGVSKNADGQLQLSLTSTLVTAPTAKENLVFNNEEQELVTAGTAENGTVMYSLDNEEWSEDIPTAIQDGTYTVYYKVKGKKLLQQKKQQKPKQQHKKQ